MVDSHEPQPSRARATPSDPRRTIRGVAISVSVHLGLAALFLGAAWGVALREDNAPPPIVLTADFFEPAPAAPETPRERAPRERPRGRTVDADALDLSSRLRELEAASGASAELDAIARRFGASGIEETTAAAPTVGATFAGLVAGNATKVAYVVDASGSMVGSFPNIIREVERSLAKLEATQQFTVVCFRRNAADAPSGDSSLRTASRANREDVMRWLRKDVVPAGRSSPLEALARALASGADCVFLLSSSVTGPGRHELDRESMLALLDRLNPRDPATGRRRATIQCIQFLEDDPGRTLEAIAAEHYGPGGYRFISRADAGLAFAPTDDDTSGTMP